MLLSIYSAGLTLENATVDQPVPAPLLSLEFKAAL